MYRNRIKIVTEGGDLFRQRVLSRVVYRLHSPPDPSAFECDFADTDPRRDTVLLLWNKGTVVGFATVRACMQRVPARYWCKIKI